MEIITGVFASTANQECLLPHMSVERACACLELTDVCLVKKQVALVSNIVYTIGVDVLKNLGLCRVWMRLCLLLMEKHAEVACEQIVRLLKLEPWSDEEFWALLKPGLIYFAQKNPAIAKSYKELMPEELLQSLRKENSKFDKLCA